MIILKSQLDFEVQKKEVLEETLQTIEQLKDEDSLRIAQLVTENARLKENDCEQCKHLDLYIKYKQTLQEIKAIASKIIDSYIRPYGDYNQLKQIIDLITKAEEE